MPREKYVPKPIYAVPVEPFKNAQEAWFWFVRCQRLRRLGARLGDGPGQVARPCDPDDIYRAVRGLADRQRIGPEHLDVLLRFGIRESPPDSRCSDEQRPARLWAESLDRLTTVLRHKGILECA